jgi:SAM-dependent MidA family methyltransferase
MIPVGDDHPVLPGVEGEARAHGERVIAGIRDAIRSSEGAIDFARFMELALYQPGLGYYSAGISRFDRGGDFVTAPQISSLFAGCLVRQIHEALDTLGEAELCEAGAGSGALAAGLLAGLEASGRLPARYAILERSAALRARQRERLENQVPHLVSRVTWLDDFPATGFRGVVLANELLDAIPAHRFRIRGQGLQELCVTWQGDRFTWLERDASGDPVAERVAEIRGSLPHGLPEGYVLEYAPAREAWLATLAERLERGVVLLLDYGYGRAEYYHPQRTDGTLRCHFRHRAHDDPLILPGLQDISVHVEFTAMVEAAVAAGLELGGYTTQAEFLLATGLLESCADLAPGRARLGELTAEIKRLTLPGEMGEAIKVLALARDYPRMSNGHMLSGFAARDQSARL